MTDKDFSYKFCKDNQLLPEVSSDSILIFHTDDCDINAIAHIQSKYKLPVETKQIDFSEFNKKLSESYSDKTQSSESLAENIHEDVDLDSLVLDLPKTEDLLDDSTDSPVIRLINAILSEAIKDGAPSLIASDKIAFISLITGESVLSSNKSSVFGKSSTKESKSTSS